MLRSQVHAADDTLVLQPTEHVLDRVDRAQGMVVGRYVIFATDELVSEFYAGAPLRMWHAEESSP